MPFPKALAGAQRILGGWWQSSWLWCCGRSCWWCSQRMTKRSSPAGSVWGRRGPVREGGKVVALLLKPSLGLFGLYFQLQQGTLLNLAKKTTKISEILIFIYISPPFIYARSWSNVYIYLFLDTLQIVVTFVILLYGFIECFNSVCELISLFLSVYSVYLYH